MRVLAGSHAVRSGGIARVGEPEAPLVNFVVRLLLFLLSIARAQLFDSWKALFALLERLEEWIERWYKRKNLPGRQGKASPYHCVPVNHPALVHPDPLIYDQYDLVSRGYAVSWDNPDIQLMQGGAAVSSSNLKPDTVYDVVARIWNGSTDAPVVNMPVDFSYLSFGIGTKSSIPETVVLPELGVKGGPNCPAFVTWHWKTPAAPGHYCIQVRLRPFDDKNFANNLGQENTNVGTAHSPADLVFALRNAGDVRHAYRFQVDSYVIPAPPPCQSGTKHQRGDAGRHDASKFPVPPGWTIAFNPVEPILGPGDQIDVHAVVTPPAAFSGTQAFNVNAFTENMDFAGGVTLYVQGS